MAAAERKRTNYGALLVSRYLCYKHELVYKCRYRDGSVLLTQPNRLSSLWSLLK